MTWSPDSIAVLVSNSVFLLLAIASVPLRFYAKRRSRTDVQIEDWCAVLSLLTSVLLYVSNVAAICFGWKDAQFVATDKVPKVIPIGYIASYISLWMFLMSVTFARLSFLHLFKRIFTGHRTPTAIMVTLVLTYICVVIWVVLMIKSCVSMRAEWHLDPSQKLYIPVFIVVGAAVDLIFDIILGILPMFYLSRLQMSKKKCRALTVVFGLGLICCIASGARLICTSIYLHGWSTGSYRASYSVLVGSYFLWPGIESCISTICISLPSYAALLSDDKKRSIKSNSLTTRTHTRNGSGGSSRSTSPEKSTFKNPDDELLDETADEIDIEVDPGTLRQV